MAMHLLAAATAQTGKNSLDSPNVFLELCREQLGTLGSVGQGFLWASLLLGMLLAVVTAINSLRLRPPPAKGAIEAKAVADPAKLTEALTKLIAELAKAPIWLAMFACGLTLHWLALSQNDGTCGKARPESAAGTAGKADDKPAPPAKPSGSPGAAPAAKAG